ncbi:hypothetical protein KYLE_83 [Pantoea phage Kyle]|uniref:Uncharacterized protein n=1 Tax=Pantoea phage Kyle TaxID=2589665 RepID=A0A514A8Q6_9CAUD|nr:hypothetical protein HWC52_gp083 [Pantoea phage Kyle]QDH49658.1 hypothetical protein KYLE_83 [Pantoea phage Kyle]
MSDQSRAGLVRHEGGWNGGRFVPELKDGDQVFIYVFGEHCDTEIKAKLRRVEIHGKDFDHGHEYAWTNEDFMVEVEGDLFNRQTSLIGLLRNPVQSNVKFVILDNNP